MSFHYEYIDQLTTLGSYWIFKAELVACEKNVFIGKLYSSVRFVILLWIVRQFNNTCKVLNFINRIRNMWEKYFFIEKLYSWVRYVISLWIDQQTKSTWKLLNSISSLRGMWEKCFYSKIIFFGRICHFIMNTLTN